MQQFGSEGLHKLLQQFILEATVWQFACIHKLGIQSSHVYLELAHRLQQDNMFVTPCTSKVTDMQLQHSP